MTTIQMSGWPIVTIEFRRAASDEDAQQWLDDLSALLAEESGFAILMQSRPESRFSPEARKQLGLWFKDNREKLAAYCRCIARVVDSKEQGERVVSDNMQKAMPFPMKAFLDIDEARDWAVGKMA